MSLPPTTYIDDGTGTIYSNKAFLNQLVVVGNTMQAGVAGNPALTTPSISYGNAYAYSFVGNGVVSQQQLFPVALDAGGRARITSDLICTGNIAASGYSGIPTYSLPSNIAVNSIQANVAQVSTLSANAGSIGALTVQSLTGYTPNNASLIGQTLNYNSGNIQVLLSQAASVSNLYANTASFGSITIANAASLAPNLANISGNAIMYQTGTFGNLYSNTASFGSISVSNTSTLFGNILGNISGNSLSYTSANVQSLTSNVANISILFVSNLVGYSPNISVANISGQVFSYSTGNVQTLTANVANIATLYCGNIVGIPAANLQNISGNALLYLSGNIQTLTSNVAQVKTLYCSNIVGYSAGVANTTDIVGNSLGYLSGNIQTLTSNVAQVKTLYCSNIIGYNAGVANTTDIVGNSLNYTVATVQTALTSRGLNLLGTNTINLGSDQSKETSAGRVGYGTYSSGAALDIIGAGTVAGQRKVEVYDMLGINTVPAYPLDVSGTIRGTQANVNVIYTNAATINGQVGLTGNNVANFGVGLGKTDTAAGTIGYQAYSTALDVVGAGNGPNRTVRVYDYLGVGTVPAYPLDIYGTVRANTNTIWQQTAGTNQGFFIGNALSTQQSSVLSFNSTPAPGALGSVGLGIFGVGQGLTIGPTGNVGINQTQPQTALDVGGTIRSSQAQIGGQLAITGTNLINLGSDQTKEASAGRVGYGTFSTGQCLDVVGAGVTAGVRKVQVYDQLGVNMVPSYTLDVLGGIRGQTANVNTFFSNTASIGQLTVSNLQGYTPTIPSNLTVTSVTASTANVSSTLLAGSRNTTTYAITLASTVGAATNICRISDPAQSSTYSVNMTLIQCQAFNAIEKSYKIHFGYNSAPFGSYYRVLPDTSSGGTNGNDFALETYTQTSSPYLTYFRVVRTAVGTNTSTSITAVVDVVSDAASPISYVYDGSTSTGANNAGIWSGSPITTVLGNVGIMTASPQYTLDVTGTGRFTGTIYQNQSQPSILLGNSTALNQACYINYNNSNNNSMGLGVFGTGQSVTVGPTGLVGINQTSPSFTLDVSGNVRSYNPNGGQMTVTYPSGGVPQIGFYTYNTPARPTPSTTITASDDGNYSGHLLFNTAPPGNTGGNAPVERMRVTTGGLVGINQPSPGYQLDVNGPSRFTLSSFSQFFQPMTAAYSVPAGGVTITNTSPWGVTNFGNSPATSDIALGSIWGSNGLMTIPVQGVWHFSFDAAFTTSQGYFGYWTIVRLGGSSSQTINQLGQNQVTGTQFSSHFTCWMASGDTCSAYINAAAATTIARYGGSIRAVLIQRC